MRLASDWLIHIPVQVRIPLAEASKNYQLLKNLFKSSCTGVYQWFDCHLPGAVVSQGISRPDDLTRNTGMTSGKHTDLILLDLRKALDKVNHLKLL